MLIVIISSATGAIHVHAVYPVIFINSMDELNDAGSHVWLVSVLVNWLNQSRRYCCFLFSVLLGIAESPLYLSVSVCVFFFFFFCSFFFFKRSVDSCLAVS